MSHTRGQHADVEAFCARLRPRLVGALRLQLGDVGVAEELAQEALARVWDRWPTVQRADSPEAWAYRVAFNLARSHFRRRAAERRANARLGPGTREGADPADADVESLMLVRAAVAALPPRQRTAIALRYYADLAVGPTAVAMGCAPGTVKALTAQGVAGLRARLGDFFAEEALDGS